MEKINKKRILILGGAGYIGTVLSTALAKSGYAVEVIDACWFGDHISNKVTLQKTDIFNLTQVDFKGFHSVIFLAGLSNDPMAEFSPAKNFIYNTGMPAFVAFMAREAGVKQMIFASSCSVYGFTNYSTFKESDITSSNYPYGVSKLQGEKSVQALAGEDFSVICFRQGTVSGYSNRMRLDLAVNTMFKNAIQHGEIQLTNSKIWRPILGLSDLVQTYKLAIESGLTGANVFNISSFNTTIGELAVDVQQYVQRLYGLKTVIVDKQIQDYRNYKVNIEHAQSVLKYVPSDTIHSILKSLSDNLTKYDDFENEAYYNIDVFRKIMVQGQLTN